LDYTLTYDAKNRLAEVKQGQNTIAQYFYDGDGCMVKKVEGGNTTLYIGSFMEVLNPVNYPSTVTPPPTFTPIFTKINAPTRTPSRTLTPTKTHTPTASYTVTSTNTPTETIPTPTGTLPTASITKTLMPSRTYIYTPSKTPTITRNHLPPPLMSKRQIKRASSTSRRVSPSAPSKVFLKGRPTPLRGSSTGRPY
jgi:YD repeat-containing protein